MTEVEWKDGDGISLFAVGTTVLQNRWRIARWMFLGVVAAALSVISRPALYSASASFVPQGVEARSSGLASLAERFGVSVPTGNQSQSPEFYVGLLKSPVLLRPIARDTFVVEEMGGQRIAFSDLFYIEAEGTRRREEQGVKLLERIIQTSATNTTRVVRLSVATLWPSVSLAIATSLVNAVNDFNQRTRQVQAAAERKFIEGRLAVIGAELREAEDRLEHFLATNRQFAGSPELTFRSERLQRDVTLQQQVFTSLTQSYEEVRIREVRDTPVITVIEPPSVPTTPEPRWLGIRVLIGLMLGGFVGVVTAFASGVISHGRKEGDAEIEEFIGALSELKSEMLAPARWVGERIRR